jgi:type IX secretion system PorP/SprF family membrane protein
MRLRKINILFLITTFIQSLTLRSQDIHFSQFYESPVLLNPAFAGGSSGNFRFVANYKNQWKSIVSPFKTVAVAFDAKVQPSKRGRLSHLGYGITLFNDQMGISKLTTNQVNLIVAYHVFLNRTSSLSAGINTGLFQKSITTNNLKWDSQFDGKGYNASLPTNEANRFQNIIKFDLGAGLRYKYFKPSSGLRLEIGNSITHVTKPTVSFYSKDPSLQLKYTCNFILQTKINEHIYLMPALMYVKQGGHSELIGGGNVKFILGEQTRDRPLLNTYTLIASSMQFGIFYRVKDAVIFTMGLDYKKNIAFGFSYDVTISKLNNANKRMGGLELSLILKGFRNLKNDRGSLKDG